MNLIWIHTTNRTWTKVKETSPRRNGHEIFKPKCQYECYFESKFSDWAFSTWASRQYRSFACMILGNDVRLENTLSCENTDLSHLKKGSYIDNWATNLEQRGLLSNEAPFFFANATNQVPLEFGSSTMWAGISCERQTSLTYPRVWSHGINNLLSYTHLTTIFEDVGLSRKRCALNFRKSQRKRLSELQMFPFKEWTQ